MRYDGSILNGNVNTSYYIVTMPRLRSGTFVLLDIYAEDQAGNAFNLSEEYNYWLAYRVMGCWIEAIDITALRLVPLAPFTVNITGIIGDGNFTVQVLAYFYNPSIGNLQGPFFKVWQRVAVNMTQIANNTYQLSWPVLSYLTHGQTIYVSIQILDSELKPTEFAWNGAYSLHNTTHNIVYTGFGMNEVVGTANITVGQIIDNVPPSLLSPPKLRIAFPTASTDVEIIINLTDTGMGVKRVTLYYRIGGAGAGVAAGADTINTAAPSNWTAVSTLYYGGVYLAIIPKQAAGSLVEYYIVAEDLLGNTYTSEIYPYNIVPANYNLYIFLIALIAIVLISTFAVRRRKRAQVAALKGPKRYKLIKQKL